MLRGSCGALRPAWEGAAGGVAPRRQPLRARSQALHSRGVPLPACLRHGKPSAHPMKLDIKLILAGAALAAAVTLAFAAPAAENWENHCAKCHGADGKGQTKVGKKLGVLDYTNAADQAKFTDEQATKAIVEGARDKAGKERMKGYQDELSPQEIKDLLAMVRNFKA